MYKDRDYIKFVNLTYSKLFSSKQLLPHFIIESPFGDCAILDYGAGKDAYGSEILKKSECFREVIAYDIGNNYIEGIHDKNALNNKYEIVMMSNVINIQPTISDIVKVLLEGKSCLKSPGRLYCNFPPQPRKNNCDDDVLYQLLKGLFDNVCTYDNNIFECDYYGK